MLIYIPCEIETVIERCGVDIITFCTLIVYNYLNAFVKVWSNDKYESVEHRVMVNSEKDRFSIPFFLNPAHYTVVKPLEELIDEKNRPKFKAYSWGKFMTHRKESNFKKQNVENIQTYHFRVQE